MAREGMSLLTTKGIQHHLPTYHYYVVWPCLAIVRLLRNHFEEVDAAVKDKLETGGPCSEYRNIYTHCGDRCMTQTGFGSCFICFWDCAKLLGLSLPVKGAMAK